MFGLNLIRDSVRRLALALDGLTATVNTLDQRLQQQLLLDGPGADDPALPGQAAAFPGPGATGADADAGDAGPGDGDAGGDGAQAQGGPAPARRNGRRRAAATD